VTDAPFDDRQRRSRRRSRGGALLDQGLLQKLLVLLGAGFLVANVRILVDGVRYLRRRSQALLTWPGPRPRYYGLFLLIGVLSGVLAFLQFFIVRRGLPHGFGESMMFVFYAWAWPWSQRIGRGLYADGVWADSGFVPYDRIGGLTWQDGEPRRLIVIDRARSMARRLTVPAAHYAALRRLLRDRIAARDIQFSGTALLLDGHDERDDI
jgi:hypothetical protein